MCEKRIYRDISDMYVHSLLNYKILHQDVLVSTFIGRHSGTCWWQVRLVITESTNYIFLTDTWDVSGSDSHFIEAEDGSCINEKKRSSIKKYLLLLRLATHPYDTNVQSILHLDLPIVCIVYI